MKCLNIKNKEVAALLDEYTNILGSYDAAYYVLSENNGYGLDKAPNGEPSKLYNDLLAIYNNDHSMAIRTKAMVYSDSFKNWFGDWTNPLKPGDIVFGHPAIGKTYSLESGKYKDKIIDWDVEFNEKRDKWIEEHSNTVKGTPEYKKARNEYLIYPENHPDYVEFLTKEWERVKNKAKKEGKILFASPHTLLKMFPQDFNRIINLKDEDFIKRNIERGGKEKESKLWKEGINTTISNTTNIPIEYLNENQHFEDYLDKYIGISKVVDENGEPLIVYHGSPNKFTIFNTGSTIGAGSYFFKNKEYAGKYLGESEDSTIYSAFLNIKNLKLYDSSELRKTTKRNGNTVLIESIFHLLYEEDINNFINSGFDGLAAAPNGLFQYVVFNPNQIKSINNQGTFSTTDNNIYRSVSSTNKSISKGRIFNSNDVNDVTTYNQLISAFYGDLTYYDSRVNSQGTTEWLKKLKKFKSKNYNGTFLFKNKKDFDYAREILIKKLGSDKFFDDYNGEIVREANNLYKIYLYKPMLDSVNSSINDDYLNYLDSKEYRDSIIPPFEDYDTIFNSPVSDVTEEATGSDKTLVSRLFDNKSKTTAREILARIKNKKNLSSMVEILEKLGDTFLDTPIYYQSVGDAETGAAAVFSHLYKGIVVYGDANFRGKDGSADITILH